ncbi:MAG TPA: hypothetical protein VER33_22725 [Polyangiaceae bacterium]|nr:hypothetical protein [Polyangiaceae bacterium]
MSWSVCSSKTWGGSGWSVLLAVLCGCTSLEDGTDTATAPLNPQWDCLKSEPERVAAIDPPPANIAYAVPIVDFTKRPPTEIPALEVDFCQLESNACNRVMGKPNMVEAVFGGAKVTVPLYVIGTRYGIHAYMRLSAPGYLPMEYYLGGELFGPPPSQAMSGVDVSGISAALGGLPVVMGLPVAPISVEAADALAEKIGKPRDPNAAIVAVRTLDCQNQYAAGVRLKLSVPGSEQTGVPFSYLTGQPRLAANAATDSRGIAGFANVEIPTGVDSTNVIVTGIAPNGMEYGAINVTIRRGAVTLASIRHGTGVYGL